MAKLRAKSGLSGAVSHPASFTRASSPDFIAISGPPSALGGGTRAPAAFGRFGCRGVGLTNSSRTCTTWLAFLPPVCRDCVSAVASLRISGVLNWLFWNVTCEKTLANAQ